MGFNDSKEFKMELTKLLTYSVEKKASDLHLSSGQPPILRIDGELVMLNKFPVLDADTLNSIVYSGLDEKQRHLFEFNLEIDFALVVPNIGGFRVNLFHQLNGIAAVCRVIPREIPTLDSLGTPAIFKQILDLSA